jgi:2,4-dienoyl-CoA reductase-like NADH-dependent reductase (Old Yellow Enzyme family)
MDLARMSTPLLFQPISFRSVTARNRFVVARSALTHHGRDH